MEPGLSSPSTYGATARPAPARTIITAGDAPAATKSLTNQASVSLTQSGFALVGLVVQDALAVGTEVDGFVSLDLVEQLGWNSHPAALASSRFDRDHR